MSLDIPALMAGLATQRPMFHSEADFQHALAWQIHREHPGARIRLETRPRRTVRLDVLVEADGHRSALELKYLADRFVGVVAGEEFALPRQSAQDISRYDYCKDIARVEQAVREGYVDDGWAIALTNDGGYWRVGTKADPIDALFRLHEGRAIEGNLRWSDRAGAGTTRGRADQLPLTGRYECRWRDYSTVVDEGSVERTFRYLALPISPIPV